MNEYDERAARRKAKAERITEKVQKELAHMLVDFRLTYNEFFKEIQARNKKLKKKEIAPQDRDNDLEQTLQVYFNGLIEKYERRIVAYIREQLTSDDDKFL